jgi:hypothetical protein
VLIDSFRPKQSPLAYAKDFLTAKQLEKYESAAISNERFWPRALGESHASDTQRVGGRPVDS